MISSRVGGIIAKWLKDTEDAVATLMSTDSTESARDQKQHRCSDASVKVDAAYKQLVTCRDASASAATAPSDVAVAAVWVQPYADLNVYHRIKIMLQDASARMSDVIAQVPPQGLRLRAVRAAYLCSQPPFVLLERLLNMANVLAANPSQRTGLLHEVTAQLLGRRMIDALSGAIRSSSAFSTFLCTRQALEGALGRRYEEVPADTRAAFAAACSSCGTAGSLGACAGAKYALFAIQALLERMARSSTPGTRLPDQLCRELETFASSGLLPAVAAGILDHPPMDGDVRDTTLHHLHNAARDTMQALVLTQVACANLWARGGAQAAASVQHLARLLCHPDVRRLQEASLERLLLHAGLQDAPGCVSGSSGPPDWWLAREEAATGRLTGIQPGAFGIQSPDGEAGELEDEHCNVVFAILGIWQEVSIAEVMAGTGAHSERPESGRGGVRGARGSQAGSSAGGPLSRALQPPPPPLQLARCTARAAEALVRLCRGQGMEGAYARAPTWQFARTRALLNLLDLAEAKSDGDSDKCLPYWLEAAAWGLALAAGAAGAAVMSRPLPRSFLGKQAEDGDMTHGVLRMLISVHRLSDDNSLGLGANEELRADCRERLRRAGLAASLDRVLRLAFTAQDRGTPAAGDALSGLVLTMPLLLTSQGLIAVLRPSCPRQETMCDGGGGPHSGGVSGGAQLGLLVTAAKRAGLLAPALAASPAAGSSREARERQRSLVDLAKSVLRLLYALQELVLSELESRPDAPWPRRSVAASPPVGGRGCAAAAAGPSADPWDAPDARCLSEALEALAYVARGTSALAASLAHVTALQAASGGAHAATARGCENDVAGALHGVVEYARLPFAFPAPQMLACQPHRLIAATCGLLAAAGSDRKPLTDELAVPVVELLVALAAREPVAPYLRDWLASEPPPPQQRQPSAGGEATQPCGSATCGCLVVPLRSILPHLLRWAPTHAGYLLAVLRMAKAAPPPLPLNPSGAELAEAFRSVDPAGAIDSFGRTAVTMARLIFDRDSQLMAKRDVQLPDGSTVFGLLDIAKASSAAAANVAASHALLPLPPLLACPAVPAAALRRLYVCGNPACANFGRAAEGDLDLKKCAGCRAVRYCCVECQRAHWRGAHKSECKELQGE